MTNPNMHSEGIDEDGEMADLPISTFYNPCIGLMDADGYLRVIQDGEGFNYETRIDKAALIAMGWTPPNPAKEAAPK